MYNSQGRRTDQPSEGGHGKSQQEAADEAGLSEHQQLQAVRVANTPESDFEKATESDIPATVTDLAEMGKQSRANIRPDTPPGFTEASKLIGSVRRFAAFCDEQEAVHVAGGVLSSEATEIRALVGTIDEWLDRFIVHLGEIQ